MVVATTKRKRGVFSTHDKLLHNSATNSSTRTGLCVRTTHESLLQYKDTEIPQKGVPIISSRGNKTWKNKGEKIILMGEINEYVVSKEIRYFATKLGLWELITDRH